jgi:hypothetical protein
MVILTMATIAVTLIGTIVSPFLVKCTYLPTKY